MKAKKVVKCEDCGAVFSVVPHNTRTKRCKPCNLAHRRERDRLYQRKINAKKRAAKLVEHQKTNGNIPITHEKMKCPDCGVKFVGWKGRTKRCKPCASKHLKEHKISHNKKLWQETKNNAEKWENRKAFQRNYYKENSEKLKTKQNDLYASSPEYRAYRKKYMENYTAKHLDENRKRARDWYSDNKERAKSKILKRAKLLGYPEAKMQRARMRDAVLPSSCKKTMVAIFTECQKLSRDTGVLHHVDHIIPLSIGGAHHQDNLRIITATENLKKRNNYDPSLGGVWANNKLAKKHKKKLNITKNNEH